MQCADRRLVVDAEKRLRHVLGEVLLELSPSGYQPIGRALAEWCELRPAMQLTDTDRAPELSHNGRAPSMYALRRISHPASAEYMGQGKPLVTYLASIDCMNVVTRAV